MNNNKDKHLSKIKPRRYLIYGIFDFETDMLVYVNMNVEQTEFEFEIGDYNTDKFDIISFYVLLD